VDAYQKDIAYFNEWCVDMNGEDLRSEDITSIDLREYQGYMQSYPVGVGVLTDYYWCPNRPLVQDNRNRIGWRKNNYRQRCKRLYFLKITLNGENKYMNYQLINCITW